MMSPWARLSALRLSLLSPPHKLRSLGDSFHYWLCPRRDRHFWQPSTCSNLWPQVADCGTTGHSSQVHKFVYALLFLCRYIDMVIQNGTTDCGLFALASTTAQPMERSLAALSLTRADVTPPDQVPWNRKSRAICCQEILKKIKSTVKVPVFCTCCMPNRSDCAMIECSACRESFHVDICVGVNTCTFDRSIKWLCTSCNM